MVWARAATWKIQARHQGISGLGMPGPFVMVLSPCDMLVEQAGPLEFPRKVPLRPRCKTSQTTACTASARGPLRPKMSCCWKAVMLEACSGSNCAQSSFRMQVQLLRSMTPLSGRGAHICCNQVCADILSSMRIPRDGGARSQTHLKLLRVAARHDLTLTKASAVWFPVMAARLATALAAAFVASSVLARWGILGAQAPARHP